MNIAVFGSGGVGGYFGGRLAAAGEEVTFIARGAHLAAMRQHGLRIESPNGSVTVSPVRATDHVDTIGPVDVVLFTVKLYDVDEAAATLGPLMGPDTVVITLQNGVDAVDMVARHVGAGHVAGGAAYIVAVIDKPGHIRHTVAHQLVFGERDGTRSPRLVAFEEACQHAGFRGKASTTIETDLWIKFVRLATWSGMTTVTRSPMGVIRDDPALLSMMMSAIDEAMAVGRARGIIFPPHGGGRDPVDGAELSARVEVVHARRPRTGPPIGVALAERRRGQDGPRIGSADADSHLHHHGDSALRPGPQMNTIIQGRRWRR